MSKEQVIITLSNDNMIPPNKAITLLKWFQKWVSPDIKKISFRKEVTAKWKNGGDAIYDTCTACNELIYLAFEMNYCPNCGAKLEANDE